MKYGQGFWAKVSKAPGGCWIWQAGKIGDGYGCYWNGSRQTLAHRYAYEQLVGPIAEGLHLDHLCRVPACVNPDHLEPVTAAENQRRGLNGILHTHCQHGHPASTENTYVDPGGGRHCRVCNREAVRRLKARRRAEAGR